MYHLNSNFHFAQVAIYVYDLYIYLFSLSRYTESEIDAISDKAPEERALLVESRR